MGSQNIPGSWVRNFIGSKFGMILISINGKQMLGYTIVGYKSVGKAYPGKPRTLVPHGQ